MKVLLEQQAQTYLIDLLEDNKSHDEDTVGFFFSDEENTWVTFNSNLEFKNCETPTEALNFLMSCK